jgi:hypothetical protein
MYPHAPFSYYFHTPRTQMTQQRFQVINDCRTSLQLLKDLRHHMSRHRETRGPRHPMPGDITVYPCPWSDLGHRRRHMSSGWIGLLLYVALFSVSVVRISVTPQFACSSHSNGSEDRTINDLCCTFILFLNVLPTVPSCHCKLRAKRTNPGRPRLIIDIALSDGQPGRGSGYSRGPIYYQ